MEINKKRIKYHYFQMKACRVLEQGDTVVLRDSDDRYLFGFCYYEFVRATGIKFRVGQKKKLYFRVGSY